MPTNKRKHEKINELLSLKQVKELAGIFSKNKKEVYLVGGSVRDALMGLSQTDLDFTTSATPDVIKRLVKEWADDIWMTGAPYGTISLNKKDLRLEITTYRNEIYRTKSRKPEVTFSQTLDEDLIRRDFTVNAMALDITSGKLIDPFGGEKDLKRKILKTPQDAEKSFSDDPLRMLRACRFVSTLLLNPEKTLFDAIKSSIDRLKIVSMERINDELTKLLLGASPAGGLKLMVDTGLADVVVPELPNLRLAQDPMFKHKDILYHTYLVVQSVSPNIVSRLAAMLHDIAKPATRKIIKGEVHFYGHDVIGARMAKKRLEALRYPSKVVKKTTELIRLHLRPYNYGMGWTDSAVRRYARDAGELLSLLNEFAVADCTTRIEKNARQILYNVEDLKERIERLEKEEELSKIRPPLNGNEVMAHLKIEPGPVLGEIMDMLLEATLDGKIKTKDEAYKLLDVRKK